jgi:Bacterial protein of unknown function (DUF924)
MYPEATELLDVWFADCGIDPRRVADQSRLCFEPSPEQDEFLRKRCGLLFMPYQHSKSLTVQYEGVSLFEGIIEAAQGEWKDLLRAFLGFACQHLEIIERFGPLPASERCSRS